MTDAIRKLFELLAKKEKSGSDYTGKVTRVDGKTAYVQFDGSDITDTPVSLSIGASPGDNVRVRVADGKAWLTGNDGSPPNDSVEALREIEATNAHIKKIETENIVGENGWINLKEGKFAYGGNALTWNGKVLGVKGNIEAGSGKIAKWSIEGDGLANESQRTGLNNTVIKANTQVMPALIRFKENYYSSAGAAYPSMGYTTDLMTNLLEVKEEIYTNGVVSSTNVSGVAPEYIYENGTMLSAKYAPRSNSDPALKENIRQSHLDALELLKHLPVHEFDWKKDGAHWPVGFIAPELYDIDSNLAEPPTGEPGSYWSVNSFYLVGVLTKAVQELTAKVEALEADNAQLKSLLL